MRKLLFASAAVLVICAAVAAAEKLSRETQQKVERIKAQVQQRIKGQPLTLEEVCWLEISRAEKEGREEEGPLLPLLALRNSLRERIAQLNPFWEPKQKIVPAKKEKYVHREYDISDLTMIPKDRPRPGVGLGRTIRGSWHPSGEGGGITDFGEEGSDEAGAGFNHETIKELIERAIGPGSANEESIQYQGGKLICDITEKDAAEIEILLQALRTASGYSVNIEARFLRVRNSFMGKFESAGNVPAIFLSAEDEKKLLAAIEKKEEVEAVASSEIIAADYQVVHIREGRQVSLLVDYDINTVGIPTLQPVVKLINEGLICQFRPVVVRGGKEVSLDIFATYSSIEKDMREGDFMGGKLMYPAMKMSCLHTMARIPGGTAALVGGTTVDKSASPDKSHEFIIYIKPTIVKSGK